MHQQQECHYRQNRKLQRQTAKQSGIGSIYIERADVLCYNNFGILCPEQICCIETERCFQ